MCARTNQDLPEMRKSILVFAPHPDDETLGCGGTIAKKSSEGYEVIVVVLTDGRHAFSKVLGIDSDPTPEELKQIRREETMRAIATLGIPKENLFFLDFEDGMLGKHEKEIEEKIMEIMKKYPPVEVYFPSAKDYNPDHQATNRIVKQSIQKSRLRPVKLEYSITQRYARVGPFLEKLVNLVKNDIAEIDISEFAGLKERAVNEFKSQISMISKEQKSPIIEHTRVEKYLTNKEKFHTDRGK